ncbi:MAG: YfcE family phosphodiesterase [Ruminococcus sp.]|nr:YfcE family phosphodiesterase [Ruminococcus sp.]
MRIIVISDTHGNKNAIDSVFLRNSDADLFIHLGDGERDIDAFLLENPSYTSRVIHVAGNCDFNSLSNDFEIIPANGHKILASHGHIYAVKNNLEIIKKTAKRLNCDIVLYGHTHVRYNKFEDDLYIMNPGSAGNPHDGKKPSFGTINIVPSGILMNIADI